MWIRFKKLEPYKHVIHSAVNKKIEFPIISKYLIKQLFIE